MVDVLHLAPLFLLLPPTCARCCCGGEDALQQDQVIFERPVEREGRGELTNADIVCHCRHQRKERDVAKDVVSAKVTADVTGDPAKRHNVCFQYIVTTNGKDGGREGKLVRRQEKPPHKGIPTGTKRAGRGRWQLLGEGEREKMWRD
jgi:hypothetical protein